MLHRVRRPTRAPFAPGGRLRDLAVILGVLIAARFLFLLLVPFEAVSSDMRAWSRVAGELTRGNNPYLTTTRLNWPPFWMQILFAVAKLNQWTGIHVFTLIRGLILLVECAVAVVLYHGLRTFGGTLDPRRLLLVAVSLNPVCILLTAQHGNFDLFVGLWILLFVAFLVAFHRSGEALDWLYACLFLGLGILTKTVPLVLVPLLAHRARGLGSRTLCLGATLVLAPVTLGMSVIYALGPEAVMERVIGYSSFHGYFGITGLIALAKGGPDAQRVHFWIFLSALLLAMASAARHLWISRRVEEGELILLAALFTVGVPTLGSGYGPQYIWWFAPLLIVLYARGDRLWRGCLLAFYVVAAVTYTLEYAMLVTHGQFLVRLAPSREMVELGLTLTRKSSQTLLRLPLFGAYLLVMAVGLRRLWQKG
jgi:hypothetical protein